jgi:hypothetical protein
MIYANRRNRTPVGATPMGVLLSNLSSAYSQELRMRESPSIIPWGELDRTAYLVLNDFSGAFGGLAWSETDVANTNRATLIHHLLEGQYSSPVRIVAFNTAEGWSRDASDEIAAELAQACADRGRTS